MIKMLTQEQFRNINFYDLNMKLLDKLKVRELKYTLSEKGRIVLDSENLKDECGILAQTFHDVRVVNFGQGFNPTNNTLWLNVSLKYTTNQGSNTLHVVNAYYNFDKNAWHYDSGRFS